MAKFFYTTTLSEERVNRAELDQRFADYALKVNTAKLDNDQFVISAGRYRHLTEPQTVFLRKEQKGTAIGGGSVALATKDGSAWNELSGMRLVYSPSLDYAGTSANRFPIGYVACEYESVLFQPHNYTLAILYSVNGGAAWSVMPNTERRFGSLNTQNSDLIPSLPYPLWTTAQKHPWTQVDDTYRPHSSYHYRALLTIAPLIGDDVAAHGNLAQIANITHFSVGIRAGDISAPAANNIHFWDTCRIWLVAEDKGA